MEDALGVKIVGVVCGVLACILPTISFSRRIKNSAFHVFSFIFCSISIYTMILHIDLNVKEANWRELSKLMPTFAFMTTALFAVTMALNFIALIMPRKKVEPKVDKKEPLKKE
ncbi:MAG: hypothetical protein ACRDA4_08300 [Filifactoraceae bacterium]